MTQHLHDAKTIKVWSQFSRWMSDHHPVIRLVILVSGLIFILIFIPPTIRITFWNGLKSHGILTSMLLVFSALALSLLWSTGQKLDAWAFLYLNVRGSRPLWLDRMMLGFTRMYIGAHYPRDVLAGAVLGSAWGLLGVIVDLYVLKGI
jgi:hypothetical protein